MAKASKGKSAKSKVTKSADVAGKKADDQVDAKSVDMKPPDANAFDEIRPRETANDEGGSRAEGASDEHPELDIEIVEDVADSPDLNDTTTASPPPPPEIATRSSGFFPLLMGGCAAGAIGYAIATYFPLTGADESELSAQAQRISELEAQLEAGPAASDLSGIEAQISEVASAGAAQMDEVAASISEQLSAFDERLVEVEKRPGSDGTLSDTALAAYQRELEDLRAQLDAQKEDVMSAAAQAEADLAAARAEAERLEQEALEAAQAASVRAAINRVAASVDTGAPFDDALASLGDLELPPGLSAAAQGGVATTAELTGEFPAVALTALATARAEGVSDDAGGLGGFLRSQFDVRSTAPREGSGPDAVLSRAEAAAKEGRFGDALAELEALPEVARAEMTDWTARAKERADVLDALATLSEMYN